MSLPCFTIFLLNLHKLIGQITTYQPTTFSMSIDVFTFLLSNRYYCCTFYLYFYIHLLTAYKQTKKPKTFLHFTLLIFKQNNRNAITLLLLLREEKGCFGARGGRKRGIAEYFCYNF